MPRPDLSLSLQFADPRHRAHLLVHGKLHAQGHDHEEPAEAERMEALESSILLRLGFGDVVPNGPLRLLAGAEALNGLLLIGWSASFLYLEMERWWPPRAFKA